MGDVTAILAIRNEEAYLGNCLRHLVRNGLRVAIIDHQSTDASAAIYQRAEFHSHLAGVWQMPFTGDFSLQAQLERKLEVAREVGGDWIVHVDADEMMHSCQEGETLADGLRRLGDQGWNAVNFEEFVFLPIERDYVADVEGYPDIELYYHFAPASGPRLMRAWRLGGAFSMTSSGGHTLEGSGLSLAPEGFALRHYIVRSQAHAFEKYTTRTFDASDLERGWHGNRVGQVREAFRLPAAARLKRLRRLGDRSLDKSDPWPVHFWQPGAADDH